MCKFDNQSIVHITLYSCTLLLLLARYVPNVAKEEYNYEISVMAYPHNLLSTVLATVAEFGVCSRQCG